MGSASNRRFSDYVCVCLNILIGTLTARFAPHVLPAAALTRWWPTTRRSGLKCEGEIGLKHLCNRWCLCFTTTERLAARLISSGFGRWWRGEGEGSLVWPISPCQDGHKKTLAPRNTSTRVYYAARCQGVYYRTVWCNKIMPPLMPFEDTDTLAEEVLLLFFFAPGRLQPCRGNRTLSKSFAGHISFDHAISTVDHSSLGVHEMIPSDVVRFDDFARLVILTQISPIYIFIYFFKSH